ncbi:Metallo-dependent phosphatase [Wolfiporia cocos MD-104 SS10]|uniref:Metallo-dependent phosphatase n=1 Tax=Wolfiporia cocos (strain MD-104) TaxID=742152 RepID=A0A2H3K1C6_WOLCO|nr:Metallo-dependent phosphatase [Wolfiporia cocos MD-104 SS10]
MPRPYLVLAVLGPLVGLALYILSPQPLALVTEQLAQWTTFGHLSPTPLIKTELKTVPDSVIESSTSRKYTRRIIAVGDLHGDMENAQAVLEMAGVVDSHGDWTGNIDIFVQTGDIIDRGDDTIKLYSWMDKLREQAHAAGGCVLTHLGNHEWMNAIGDWRYVPQSEIKTFGSVASRQEMLSSGPIGKSWAANYTVASRLPLHPSLGPPNTDYDPFSAAAATPLSHAALSFVHGGLAPQYPDLTPYPSRINALGSSLLHKLQARRQPPPHPPNPYPGLPADATDAEDRLYGTDGPLWYRGWALDPEEKVCKEVDAVLEKTGTRRMIMGHTPDFEKIVSRCGGKIIVIDTGISHAYGGALSALSITYTLQPLSDNRWLEKEEVTALYKDQQELLTHNERGFQGNLQL